MEEGQVAAEINGSSPTGLKGKRRKKKEEGETA